MELTRYVVLNPVRAKMVHEPADWPWSSYRAMVGIADSPSWLETEELLAQFSDQVVEARARYARFVAEGMGAASPWDHLKEQIYLGDEEFIKRMQANIGTVQTDVNIPKRQRRPPAPSLEHLASHHADRDRAILAAYRTGHYSYQEIGKFFGLHFTMVGQIVCKGPK